MDKKYNSAINLIEADNELNKILNLKELKNNLKDNQLLSFPNKSYSKKKLNNNKIRPNELILEALKIGEKIKSAQYLENKNNLNILDIIDDAKISARATYLNHKTEKGKRKVKKELKDILKSINKSALNKLENFYSDIINIRNSQTKIIKENEILDLNLSKINNDVKILNEKLLKKNEEISQWQVKFDCFKNIMPFFEELVLKFPNKEPKQLIYNYFKNKNKSLEQLNQFDKLEEEYFNANNQRKNILKMENDEKLKIQIRIDEEKKIFQTKKNLLEQEIVMHQKLYDNLQTIKENQKNLKILLFNLYKNLKKYIPERNYNEFIQEIGYNPIKNEKEFDPLIFYNEYFIKLITECIVNKASQSNEGKLLRITIVFANYLSRKYLLKNKKKNYRYDPVNSFKDLKILIDKIKFDNNRLKAVIINLKQKQSDLKSKRKNLENLLQKRKNEYKDLLTKLEKAKKIQLSIFKSKQIKNKKEDNSKESNKKLVRALSEKNIKVENNNKDNLFKTIYNNKTSKFFLTNTEKVKKINKNIINNGYNNKRNKLKIKTEKKINNIKIDDELREIMSNFKKMKDIKMSKNRDKLYKTNGFNSEGNIFFNAKALIKEISDIYKNQSFNKSNIKQKNKKDIYTIETYEELPSIMKNKAIKKYKFRKEQKIKTVRPKRPFSSQINNEENYQIISNKIIDNIDNIINTINGIKSHNFENEDKNIINNPNIELRNKEGIKREKEKDHNENKNNNNREQKRNNVYLYNEQSISENDINNDVRDTI